MTIAPATAATPAVNRTNKVLTPQEVAGYHDRGFHFPLDVLSASETRAYRDKLEAFEARNGGPISGELRSKPHLLFTWLDELIFHPKILDAVEDLYGPNLLVWSTSFFNKEPHDPSYVSWHQDSTYWGLSSPDVVTAWIALSPSTVESGCMKVIPGSHLKDQLPHTDTFAKNNLLTRGQEVAVEVNEADAVHMPLEPGQVSLHHVRLVHGSPPNESNDRRLGFAIRYVPTYVRQITGMRDRAVLVRGVDTYHHFDPERRPTVDYGEAERAHHARSAEEAMRILYRGTDRAPQ